MKKLISLLLTLVLAITALPALAEDGMRTFIDSVGREVALPANITRIAVSGPLAQIVVFAIAPDLLAGVSSEWDAEAKPFIPEEYLNLPELGQLYGGKGDLNPESLLMASPDVVIDVGEPKGDVVGDLDALTQQTGIPFVHITATLSTLDETYAKLGELLGREEQAKVLSDYCRSVYDRAVSIGSSVEKKNLLYITTLEGLSVIGANSYHSEVIDLLGNNLAVLESPSSRGTGNEVGMEQMLLWNPDYIIFSPDSIYSEVGTLPEWQTITAVQNGTYYEVPLGPYNWMGFPPSAQRLLGMVWMAKVLYPETATYDLYEEICTYFKLFYHCELTQEQYDLLMQNALGNP